MPEKKREESSFTVTDRRLFTSDGELRSEVKDEPQEPKATNPPPKPAASTEKAPAPMAVESP